jgi:hypothetical protein
MTPGMLADVGAGILAGASALAGAFLVGIQVGRAWGVAEGRAEAGAEVRRRAWNALRGATGAGSVAEVAGRPWPLDPRSVSAGAWRVARAFLDPGGR